MKLVTEFTEGLSISAHAILANKLRSTLTTLGIVIGIVTVSLMAMAIDGLHQTFMRSVSAIGERIQIGGKNFEVIGVNEKFGTFIWGNMDSQVIIPITRFLSDFSWRPYVFFMVNVRDVTVLYTQPDGDE